jgi:hypothetical protein
MQRASVRPAIRPQCAGCGRLAGEPVRVAPVEGTGSTVLRICSSCMERPHMLIWRKWKLA